MFIQFSMTGTGALCAKIGGEAENHRAAITKPD
jgi:hypothetical protein